MQQACYGTLVVPKLAEGVRMNGERIIKFSGQGSVYIRCLEPLEEEDDEDGQLLRSAFDDEKSSDTSTSQNVVTSRNSFDEIMQATEASPSVFVEEVDLTLFDEEINETLVQEQLSSNCEDVHANIPLRSSASSSTSNQDMPTKVIKVHRSLIREDMLNIFSDESVLQNSLHAIIVNQLGHEEAGKGSGALREVFSLFWKEAYESYMLGESERVPYIRHDINRKKWEAFGRILVKGYTECHYFSFRLSKAFFIACLFGESCVTYKMLQDSFKHYLSSSEANMLCACLNNSVRCDDDELLEFLSAFDCKRRVSENSLVDIVTEIAHKEIIQKPQYVADCWAPIFSSLRKYFPDVSSVDTLYKSIVPTNAKVIAMLQANPVTPAEGEAFAYIKRFIRGLDEGKLSTFLRFTTASDVLVSDSMTVVFTSHEGLQRRPAAHTCGCVLEVPSTYSNFCELREEFMGILNADGWEMNIV